MNSIRSKLKHGFGKKRATTSRQTATTSRQAAVKPSIAATVADDLRTSKRHTKRKTEREARTSPEIVSQTASDMERLRAKSQYVRGKKKSYKSSKLYTTDSFEEVMTVRNSLFGPSRICDSLHEGSLMLQTKLHIHVDRLFQLLFSNSNFFADFQAKRQTTELQLGQWSNSKNGERARIVSMTVTLNVTVGPKVSKVTEQQKMRQCSTPGELYSIDIVCTQEGIPYADVFNVILHYCLVGHLKNHTELMVYANVNFIKSTWAVIKTFIMKHSFEGLAVYFGDLHKELLNEISNSKGK